MSGRRGAAARQMQQVPEPMEQVVQTEVVSRKRPWEKVDADGNKIKRKKVPGAKNIRIRKHVQPRNACQCLHELVPGVSYNTDEGGVGQTYTISVTIEGETFRGSGPALKIARQNAAEAALVSFVKPPVPKAGPEEENDTEDKTPWATLASFAMYKLFMDWKEGRVGTCNSQNLQGYLMTDSESSAAISQHLVAPGAWAAGSGDMKQKMQENAKNGTKPGKQGLDNPTARPAKQVPDNAAAMHPVMILHQMRPGLQYTTNKTAGDDNKSYFYVSVNIDGQEFTGEGINVKKAKFQLARDAIYSLFGVESCFELPA